MDYNDARIKLTIDGIDMTWHLKQGSFKVSNVLTKRVDTLSFELNRMYDVDITEWSEVILTNGTEKVFAGHLLSPSGGGQLENLTLRVTCGDYSAYTDKVIIKAAYVNKTDAYILNDLFTTYYPEVDATTHVTTLATHSNLQFNRNKLREIIDYLAEQANAEWYIDYDKKLRFFQKESGIYQAPFGISSVPDNVNTFPCQDLTIDRDGTGIVNLVEVVGGIYLSDDQTIYLPGTGQSNRISLPLRMRGPAAGGGIQVWRNDGTQGSPIWTSLTVLTAYINSLTTTGQVLYYYEEKALEQQNSFPDLPNAVKVFGRYEIPLRVRVRDNASYALYGKWFYDVINDPNIVDKQTARVAGKARLAEKSLANPTVKFTCFKSGLRAGQVIAISNIPSRLNGNYLIYKVDTTDKKGGLLGYSVECGVYNPDLIDTLVSLARNSKQKTAWNDNEVLDELLGTEETLKISDVHRMTAQTPTYKWGPDANAFRWDFFTWS